MSTSKTTSIQFTGSRKLADFLKGLAKERSADLTIISSREEKDPAQLGMSLVDVWHIVVGAAEVYSVAHLTHDLTHYFRTTKEKEVIAKTPSREISIKVDPGASEAEVEVVVRAKVEALLGAPPK